MPKVLILYTAHTIGHKRIALNIGHWLRGLGFEVKELDALGLVQTNKEVSRFLNIHTFLYKHFAFVWKWLYDYGYKIFLPPVKFFGTRKYSPYILSLLEQEKPDLVITTQISPSSVLDYLKRKKLYKNKWLIAFSDYHFHPAWAFKTADGFLANIQEQKEALVNLGYSSKNILTGGLWYPPRPLVNRNEVLQELGIEKNANVVLVSAGSTAWVEFTQITETLKDLVELGRQANLNIRPLIVCGKNTELLKLLNETAPKESVVLGWQQDMHSLYAISDIFLTKPGGLSIAESLQWNLPAFIPFLLQGQENHNMNYLLKKKLVVSLMAEEPAQWPKILLKEILSSEHKQQLASNPLRSEIVGTSLSGKLANLTNALFHERKTDV